MRPKFPNNSMYFCFTSEFYKIPVVTRMDVEVSCPQQEELINCLLNANFHLPHHLFFLLDIFHFLPYSVTHRITYTIFHTVLLDIKSDFITTIFQAPSKHPNCFYLNKIYNETENTSQSLRLKRK